MIRAMLASWLLVAMPVAAQDHSSHQPSEDPHAHHGPATPPAADASQPTASEQGHVPPDPPQSPLRPMSEHEMTELMQMEDDAPFGQVLFDQLEWREHDHADVQAWEIQAWYGSDYDKLWLQSEGTRENGDTHGRVEAMWDHVVSRWWSVQTGMRQDFGTGPSRTWLDVGLRGLAPYFFEIDAGLYIGEGGRTALRFSGEYDLLLTQRLILQPEVEISAYGKDDPRNLIGSGLATIEIGLRLRYEIRRELAPYVGLYWERKFGETADLVRDNNGDAEDLSLLTGLRVWF